MLTPIRPRPGTTASAPGAEDAVDLLLACHARIRRFAALAARLPGATDAPTAELADAAARVARYFRHALPLHSSDEDDLVIPRLDGFVPEETWGTLELVTRQHVELHALLAELLPAWDALAAEPGRRGDLAGELGGARHLEERFLEHLALEEEHLFPAIRRHLVPPEQAAILASMRARRTEG